MSSFQIYNRWGNLVYNNETPDTGWDGKKDGEDQTADTYIFYLVFKRPSGTEELIRGDFTLIR